MRKLAFVNTADEAVENVHRFEGELDGSAGLRERASRVHAWYGVRRSGRWIFAPSKFIGYRANTASQYLRTATVAGGAHGGKTEALLTNWFEPVDLDSTLGRELSSALVEFLANRSLMPRKSFRINALKSELDKLPGAPNVGLSIKGDFQDRISSHPDICGGRPCIKGTRMRVSDLVDMLAEGATPTEIVDDFPYISQQDVAAALAFAARAVDHRLVRTP